MLEIRPKTEEIRRYRTWEAALGRLMRELEQLEAAKAPGAKYLLRDEIKRTTREIDELQVPQRWRSWDELGRSIETGKPAHRHSW